MDDYICPSCDETWEVNDKNGLAPEQIKSGYWEHKTDSENCPACELDIKTVIDDPIQSQYLMKDWEWIYNRR